MPMKAGTAGLAMGNTHITATPEGPNSQNESWGPGASGLWLQQVVKGMRRWLGEYLYVG